MFKLEQIDRKYGLSNLGATIVDLGAAPGGWSQYAAAQTGVAGKVVSVDLKAMQPIDNVITIQGDFTNATVVSKIVAALNNRPVDLVLSDMAPNISGISNIDQARMTTLQCAIINFCRCYLKPNGDLLIKLFMGYSAEETRNQMANYFTQVRTVKPDASRSKSKEIYLLARGYRQS